MTAMTVQVQRGSERRGIVITQSGRVIKSRKGKEEDIKRQTQLILSKQKEKFSFPCKDQLNELYSQQKVKQSRTQRTI